MASVIQFPVSIALSIRNKWAQRAVSRQQNPSLSRKQRWGIKWPSVQPLRRLCTSISTRLGGNYMHLGVLVITTTLFAVTIWFSRLTFVVENGSRGISHLHFASGLAILRILQGATSTCTTFSIAQTFEILEWTVARNFELLMSTFLALSPTTGVLGLLMLAVSCNTRLADKSWSLLRCVSE